VLPRENLDRPAGGTPRALADAVVLMLAPLAPHIAEELWARTGRPYSIHQQSWPSFDPQLAADDQV